MSFLLGLTGSIGMGKTTTARLFADQGIPVWDADAAVHALYGGAAVDAIAAIWPQAISANVVDRTALRQIIASDDTALARLESVIHPLVAADRHSFIQSHQQHAILLFDIPLLFETQAQRWLDAVVVVTAPAKVQRARVLARPGMTPAQLDLILSRQMPDAEKRARADYLVETVTHDAAQRQVMQIMTDIRARLDA